MTNCIFYIQNNIEPGSNIGVNKIEAPYTAYVLLYDYDLVYYDYGYNISIQEFANFTQINNLSYLIINLRFYNEDFINEFSNQTWHILTAGAEQEIDYQLYRILSFS